MHIRFGKFITTIEVFVIITLGLDPSSESIFQSIGVSVNRYLISLVSISLRHLHLTTILLECNNYLAHLVAWLLHNTNHSSGITEAGNYQR